MTQMTTYGGCDAEVRGGAVDGGEGGGNGEHHNTGSPEAIEWPSCLHGTDEYPRRRLTPLRSLLPRPNTRLIAGHYPGSFDPAEARIKLKTLVDFRVDYFVDVTSPDDRLTPYEEMLREEAGERGIEYRSFPIPDMGVTDSETMNRILDELDAAGNAGHTTYVHCWGGVGRTGSVVGCYLVGRSVHPRAARYGGSSTVRNRRQLHAA